jgi:hypothetical protein
MLPDSAERDDEPADGDRNLGNLLSGRLEEVDIDSVEEVRDVCER